MRSWPPEAAVEEAMAHLNSGVTTNNLATNSWSNVGSGLYSKTNVLGSSYSVVTIKIAPAVTNTDPVIFSTSYVPTPIRSSTLSRTIEVITKANYSSGYSGAILARSNIVFSGSTVTVDSFDSSNPSYSTGGQYDAAKALANGNVITTSAASNAIYVGDSRIIGSVETPPGGIVGYDTKNNATYLVGDSNYVATGIATATAGIQAGHDIQTTAYNNTITDVTLPNVSWTTVNALSGNSGKLTINGSTFTFPWQFTSSGNYEVNTSIGSSIYISAPNVQIYVTGGVNLGSGTEIYVAPGASASMYVAGSAVSIGGQGLVNTTGLAQNFTLYGLPTCTSVGAQGNAGFTGVIDAPEATVTLGGGGSSNGTTNDFSGQVICNSFKMNGNFNLHYDQSLGSTPTFHGYQASFWAEL